MVASIEHCKCFICSAYERCEPVCIPSCASLTIWMEAALHRGTWRGPGGEQLVVNCSSVGTLPPSTEKHGEWNTLINVTDSHIASPQTNCQGKCTTQETLQKPMCQIANHTLPFASFYCCWSHRADLSPCYMNRFPVRTEKDK